MKMIIARCYQHRAGTDNDDANLNSEGYNALRCNRI